VEEKKEGIREGRNGSSVNLREEMGRERNGRERKGDQEDRWGRGGQKSVKGGGLGRG
jgi:hypothetical protein